MAGLLEGRVAVVTGAGHGIGRAVAMLMAQEGAKVVVNAIHPPDEVVQEVKKLGGEAVANSDSVATPEGGENIIRTAFEKYGRIDILVNNAGIVRARMIYKETQDDWDAVIKVHLYGHFHCTRPASIIMKNQLWGRIINISSEAGLGHVMGSSSYAAAKEGIVGFTRAVAADLFRYKITCNAIRPLALTRQFDEKQREAFLRQGQKEAVELIESSKPEDVAPFIVYLAAEEAGNITGRTFSLAGGTISLMSEPENFKTIHKAGRWTLEELRQIVPRTVAASLFQPGEFGRP